MSPKCQCCSQPAAIYCAFHAFAGPFCGFNDGSGYVPGGVLKMRGASVNRVTGALHHEHRVILDQPHPFRRELLARRGYVAENPWRHWAISPFLRTAS
jgi:hypothetical protein